MSMTFTQIRETTFEELQANAGVVLTTFDPSTFNGELQRSNILFGTNGGITVSDTPEFRDAADSIDNAPEGMMEFKQIKRRTIRVTGSKITFTPESVKMDMTAADVSTLDGKANVTKITPRDLLAKEDFKDFWVLGDYGVGGYFAVHIMNALSTGGFNWKTANEGNGSTDFEYTAHYSIKNPSLVPYDVYIFKPATTA